MILKHYLFYPPFFIFTSLLLYKNHERKRSIYLKFILLCTYLVVSPKSRLSLFLRRIYSSFDII